jgi:hypothetical protein
VSRPGRRIPRYCAPPVPVEEEVGERKSWSWKFWRNTSLFKAGSRTANPSRRRSGKLVTESTTSIYYCSYCIYLKHYPKGNASSFKTWDSFTIHIYPNITSEIKNISLLRTQMLGTVIKMKNAYEISSTNVHSWFTEISV